MTKTATGEMGKYECVWRSRTHLLERADQRLRVIIVGGMNSALVEFEDGHRCVTSRFNYRCGAAGSGRLQPIASNTAAQAVAGLQNAQ